MASITVTLTAQRTFEVPDGEDLTGFALDIIEEGEDYPEDFVWATAPRDMSWGWEEN